jgi:hypothetical protein
MTPLDRDAAASDALLTDLYLDALLAGGARAGGGAASAPMGGLAGRGNDLNTILPDIDPVARSAADRLRHDLLRVHPSFRFEERLATRLAEAAMSMRLPTAVGAEGRVVPFRSRMPTTPGQQDESPEVRERARPLLIGGALTSAALSLAGAAFVAWRRGRPGAAPRRRSAMGRAARAAHATGRGRRTAGSTRSEPRRLV